MSETENILDSLRYSAKHMDKQRFMQMEQQREARRLIETPLVGMLQGKLTEQTPNYTHPLQALEDRVTTHDDILKSLLQRIMTLELESATWKGKYQKLEAARRDNLWGLRRQVANFILEKEPVPEWNTISANPTEDHGMTLEKLQSAIDKINAMDSIRAKIGEKT